MERLACLSRRRHVDPSLQGDRTVLIDSGDGPSKFVSNVVVTSRYTWFNFVPLFLLEQFTRFANAFFLLVSILQTIPSVSITAGIPTNFLPLSIVLLFDGVITAREDYKRHKDDARANSSRVLALRGGAFTEITWADVRVGDLLKLQRNHAVPADCVFLASHSTDFNSPDVCFVQTAQLDGETSLRLKQAVPATAAYFTSDEAAAAFRGRIVCEAPNAAFDKFVGMLHMEGSGGSSHGGHGGHGDRSNAPIPLEADQLLLRGSVLRNVDHAYAMVCYTGVETKVRVRQTTRPTKKPQVENVLNKLILFLVLVLLIMCTIGAVGSVLWTRSHLASKGVWYLQLKNVSAVNVIQLLFTYFLLNAGFIPVSLYVSVRLTRSLQMVIMEWDTAMLHIDAAQVEATGGLEGKYPFKVRTMDLNDELGQVSHIFSDKTGTLTQNCMEFRKLLVRGVAYGLGSTQIGIDRMRREGKDVSKAVEQLRLEQAAVLAGETSGAGAGAGAATSPRAKLPHVSFQDGSESHPGRSFFSDAATPSDGGQGTAIFTFLLHLGLNHTVLPELLRDSEGNLLSCRLSASSPDEEAFLYAAEHFGCKFVARSHDSISLRLRHGMASLPLPVYVYTGPLPEGTQFPAVPGMEIASAGAQVWDDTNSTLATFRMVHILAYTQERKRMSVIVELPVKLPDGRLALVPGQGDLLLFCKGADSALLPLLVETTDPAELQLRKQTRRQLAEWGSDGLRTLVFAYKRLDRQAFSEWNTRYAAACASIVEARKRKDKQPNAIDGLQSEMEQQLQLQGATANEDKLQEQVPETIATLAQAGIRIWMVTGDKQETAVNIGYATRLLDDTMRQIVATVESAGSPAQALKRIRIAAKRMRAEQRKDAEAAAAGQGNNVGAAITWLSKQVELMEANMGMNVQEAGHATNLDISAAAGLTRPRVEDAGAGTASVLGGAGPATASGAASVSRSSVTGGAAAPAATPAGSERTFFGRLSIRGRTGSSLIGGGGAASTTDPQTQSSSPRAASSLAPSASADNLADRPTSPGGFSLSSHAARERAASFASEEGEEEEGIAGGDEAIGHTALRVAAPPISPTDPHTGVVTSAHSHAHSHSHSHALSGASAGSRSHAAPGSSSGSRSPGFSVTIASPEGAHPGRTGSGASGVSGGSGGSGGAGFDGVVPHPGSPTRSNSRGSHTGTTSARDLRYGAGAHVDGAAVPVPGAPHAPDAADLAATLLTAPPLLGAQRRPYALIIDEGTLDACLSQPRTKAYLLYVAVHCAAVIACRARPDQKAQVVRLIRHGMPHSRTLAIGDGANDVDMITQAHVGVGISGAEGVQAANASDFAIGRFRFLSRLLLVHGRWNYRRMALLVLYMLWKNVIFATTQFCYQWYNGFSSQKWFLELAMQTWNLLFTSLPVLLLSVYDRDLDAEWVLRFPKLYDYGRLNRGINLRTFLSWFADAIVLAVINAVVTIHTFSLPDTPRSAHSGGPVTPYVFSMGTVAYTNLLVIVSLRVAAELNYHHVVFQLVLLGSVLIWIPSTFLLDYLKQDGMRGGIRMLFGSANFWFTVLLVGAIAGGKILAFKAWRRLFRPDFRHVVSEVAAGLTQDVSSLEVYSEAAELARRTGKSIAEVYEAEKIAAAAAEALAPALAGAERAGVYPSTFTAFHQRQLGAGARGTASADMASGLRQRVVSWRAAMRGGEEQPTAAGTSAAASVVVRQPVAAGRSHGSIVDAYTSKGPIAAPISEDGQWYEMLEAEGSSAGSATAFLPSTAAAHAAATASAAHAPGSGTATSVPTAGANRTVAINVAASAARAAAASAAAEAEAVAAAADRARLQLLESVLLPQRPRFDTGGAPGYDPSADFDVGLEDDNVGSSQLQLQRRGGPWGSARKGKQQTSSGDGAGRAPGQRQWTTVHSHSDEGPEGAEAVPSRRRSAEAAALPPVTPARSRLPFSRGGEGAGSAGQFTVSPPSTGSTAPGSAGGSAATGLRARMRSFEAEDVHVVRNILSAATASSGATTAIATATASPGRQAANTHDEALPAAAVQQSLGGGFGFNLDPKASEYVAAHYASGSSTGSSTSGGGGAGAGGSR